MFMFCLCSDVITEYLVSYDHRAALSDVDVLWNPFYSTGETTA